MLAVLGLIPVLLLIHLLRPKPKQVDVTNLFLWQAVLRERGGRVRLKRLKKSLPLLLQTLMIVCAALALARPVWTYLTPQTGDMLLIIDTSASMKTRTGTGTRFERARQQALELLEQRTPRQQMLIIEAGYEPQVLGGFMKQTQPAKQQINALAPSDTPGNLEQALHLALSFLQPGHDDTIYVITDGAGCDFAELVQLHPRIRPVLITGGERNVGITKFELRQVIGRPHQYEIMVEVQNFTNRPLDCPVRLSVDRTIIAEARMSFAAGERHVLFFPYAGLLTGIARAELDIADDFEVDDAAYLALSPARDLWVLLASEGNYFLERLLETYPNVLVNAITAIEPSSWNEQTARHDLVIVDRLDCPPTNKGNLLLIDAYSPSLPFEKVGQVTFPQILDWERDSPLMRDVNLHGVTIEEAALLQSDGRRPVAEAAQTGLIYTYKEAGVRAVFLGFDLTRSDLPLRVAFPVLLSNIINWLNPQKLTDSAFRANAGEPYPIYLSPHTQEFFVRPPGQRAQKYAADTNPVVFTATTDVGVYTITENQKPRYFTVNLVNAAESDIQTATLPETPGQTSDLTDPIQVQQPLWPVGVLLCLLLLVGEWAVWLRTA